MLDHLTLKPNFPDTIRRFAAWWNGELLERPPVSCAVKPARPYRGPTKQHPTLRERWLDAEHFVDSAIARLEQRDFPAESLPQVRPYVGPELMSTLLGCELEFGEDTSWSIPVVHDPADWPRLLATPPRFDNPYWSTVERMQALALERSHGRYLVGLTDLVGNYDILAALRDPQQLCLDFVDCPDLLRQVAAHASDIWRQALARQSAPLRAAGQGCTTWAPAYHPGTYYAAQCDFWCMLSTAMARDFVIPALRTELAALDRSIFHLDGPAALRHLDLLLDLPELHAVQWISGAGQGPVFRWLDIYRRIQAAGKGLQVYVSDGQQALSVIEAIGPKGVWLTINFEFASVAEVEAFLRELERVCRNSRSEIRG